MINNPWDFNDSDNDQDYIDENGDECDGDNCANDGHEIIFVLMMMMKNVSTIYLCRGSLGPCRVSPPRWAHCRPDSGPGRSWTGPGPQPGHTGLDTHSNPTKDPIPPVLTHCCLMANNMKHKVQMQHVSHYTVSRSIKLLTLYSSSTFS